MALRPLGQSGVRVTELGFGGGPIGRAASDAEEVATVDAAWACGIRYFDTAQLYGRASFVISTKIGRLLRPAEAADSERHALVDAPSLDAVYDYSRDGVRRSLEESQQRLRLGPPDIVLIHDIDRWTHGERQPGLAHGRESRCRTGSAQKAPRASCSRAAIDPE
jgi:D-threo-aldose 1-dehydrogenase